MNSAVLAVFYIILLAAAVQDMAVLRISNLLSAALFLLFGVWLAANGVGAALWQNAALFGLVFAIGALLFAIRWLGGGDVKLLAAAAIWFNLQGGLALLVSISLCGGVLGLILIVGRKLIPEGVRARLGSPALQPRGPIPYGLAIAAGAAMVMALHGPNPSGRAQLPDLHLSAFPR